VLPLERESLHTERSYKSTLHYEYDEIDEKCGEIKENLIAILNEEDGFENLFTYEAC